MAMSSALARLSTLEELTPALLRDLDVELLCRLANALPRRIALAVRDALNLIEPGDRVADVLRVLQRFLALLGKREGGIREPVLLRSAEPLGAPRHLLAPGPVALCLPGLRQVLAGGLLLL